MFGRLHFDFENITQWSDSFAKIWLFAGEEKSVAIGCAPKLLSTTRFVCSPDWRAHPTLAATVQSHIWGQSHTLDMSNNNPQQRD